MRYPESLLKICPFIDTPLLSTRTYVGIGGAAPLLLEPQNREELAEAVSILAQEGLPFRIIGGGSNLLVHDKGLEEVLISTKRLSRLFNIATEEFLLGVEAGVSTARFVSTCQKFGLSGAECLIGIPGTMGGAAMMNAGGRHGDIGQLIRRVTLLDREGKLEERELKPEDFGYRTSPLKQKIVVDIELELEQKSKDDIWDCMFSILKEKKEAQPLLEKSCGCVFKNPTGDSAGKLLESVGMKGFTQGGAMVSEKHANFVLNRDKSSFCDYFSLIEEGQERVKKNLNINLALEVEIWS